MAAISIAYTKLHQCLCYCRSLIEDDNSGILQSINESIQRLEQPMQLAIIGKISTSKSTLVNLILGQKDIVATDGKELTYNVNWLIPGNENADIEIVFKDGSKAYRPQSEWKLLSNRPACDTNENSELLNCINKIKYIRVPYACDMLKDINIIDTLVCFLFTVPIRKTQLISCQKLNQMQSLCFLQRIYLQKMLLLCLIFKKVKARLCFH